MKRVDNIGVSLRDPYYVLDEHEDKVLTIQQLMEAVGKGYVVYNDNEYEHYGGGIFVMESDLSDRPRHRVNDINSRSFVLTTYAGEDGRLRFKIDNDFPWHMMYYPENGSVPRTRRIPDTLGTGSIYFLSGLPEGARYEDSTGMEFVVINKWETIEHNCRYVIRADKFESICDILEQTKISEQDLIDEGGFLINSALKQPYNDAWLELAVGKNGATPEDYDEAASRLQSIQEKLDNAGRDSTFYLALSYIEPNSMKLLQLRADRNLVKPNGFIGYSHQRLSRNAGVTLYSK